MGELFVEGAVPNLRTDYTSHREERSQRFLILFGYCLVPVAEENNCSLAFELNINAARKDPCEGLSPGTTCLAVVLTDGSHKFPLAAKMSSDGGTYPCACGVRPPYRPQVAGSICTGRSSPRMTLDSSFIGIKR